MALYVVLKLVCQRTQKDVSLQHIPETCPGNFFRSVRFGPCYMSLLQSPATSPLSVYLRVCP